MERSGEKEVGRGFKELKELSGRTVNQFSMIVDTKLICHSDPEAMGNALGRLHAFLVLSLFFLFFEIYFWIVGVGNS